MKDYIVYVAGGQHEVKAYSREHAIEQLHEDERPWVLDVVEV